MLDTIKSEILWTLPGKSPSKSASGKISFVKFSEFPQITKKVDNSKQGVPPFDVKVKWHVNHSYLFIILSYLFADISQNIVF